GFAVGHPLANNFSIAATAETFERYFDVKLEPLQGGRMKIVSAEPISDLELPNSALPLPLKDKVSAVLFTPPPDFGPGPNSGSIQDSAACPFACNCGENAPIFNEITTIELDQSPTVHTGPSISKRARNVQTCGSKVTKGCRAANHYRRRPLLGQGLTGGGY